MNRNLKLFFVSFFVSIFLWGGFNLGSKHLEDFLANNVYRVQTQLLFAQIKPSVFRKINNEIPEIGAESALSVKISKSGNEQVLFEKNPSEVLPIASLTKLTTAFVALEFYDSSQTVEVSEIAVEQPENFGQLKVGEKLSVENLLYTTLIESSNDSAYALSELISKKAFVNLMNIEAKDLGLSNTHFTDPAGYDPGNRSTAKDLVRLTQYLLEEKPEIWEITVNPEYKLYDPDGVFHHQLLSTNKMLKEFPQIIGGKTGYTLAAKGCLIVILKERITGSIFINVVLGSNDRFGDMRKLIKYNP